MTGFFALVFVAVGISSQLTAMPAQAYSADAFVMKIDTTKVSESHTSFIIQTVGDGYNYTIDCDDTGSLASASAQTGNYTCEYGSPGTYTIVITGTFPQISMMNTEEEGEAVVNAKALMSIEKWGTQQWRSMEYAFAYARNMNISPSAGIPDLSQVTNMQGMFTYAYSFNSPLSDWDVSNVTDMSGMFQLATSFNQPLDSWDVSNVTGMAYMFAMASSFDYSLGAWDLNGEVNTMGILEDSAYSAKSYDATLRAGSSRADVLEQVSFDARDLHYCAGVEARAALVETHDWSIENDTENCTVVHPTITSVEIKPEGEKQVMIINGENLLLGGDPDEEISNAAAAAILYGGQVHVNGQKYNLCLPDGFTLEDIGPTMPVSDNPPCFYFRTLNLRYGFQMCSIVARPALFPSGKRQRLSLINP